MKASCLLLAFIPFVFTADSSVPEIQDGKKSVDFKQYMQKRSHHITKRVWASYMRKHAQAHQQGQQLQIALSWRDIW